MQAAAVLAGADAAIVARSATSDGCWASRSSCSDDLLGVFGDPDATGKSRLATCARARHRLVTPRPRHLRLAEHRAALGRPGPDRGRRRRVRAALRELRLAQLRRDLVADHVDAPRRRARRSALPATSRRLAGLSVCGAARGVTRRSTRRGVPLRRRRRTAPAALRSYDEVARRSAAVHPARTPRRSGWPPGCSASRCAPTCATSTPWSASPTRSSTRPATGRSTPSAARARSTRSRPRSHAALRSGHSSNLSCTPSPAPPARAASAPTWSRRSSPRCAPTSTDADARPGQLRAATSTARPRSSA